MSELENLKKVKSADISEFDGIKSIIEKVELLNVEKKTFGEDTKEVRQVLIETKNLSDDETPVTAKEWIGLKNVKGEWVIPDNKNAKAIKFMSYFKVDNLAQLEGKECLVVGRDKGNERIVLGIHHG